MSELGLDVQYVCEAEYTFERVRELCSENVRLIFFGWDAPSESRCDIVRRMRPELAEDVPIAALGGRRSKEMEADAVSAGVSIFLYRPCYRSKMAGLLERLSGEEKREEQSEILPDYSGKRLLLVEDNAINREIARELIGETGVQIEEACDGKEAVRKVAESEEGYYDLILMDIQMPEMDGYEATRAIRALVRKDVCDMPIIAMTANAFDEDVRMALRAGMNAHFSKPIDIRTLRHMLYEYLSRRRKDRPE